MSECNIREIQSACPTCGTLNTIAGANVIGRMEVVCSNCGAVLGTLDQLPPVETEEPAEKSAPES